MLIGDYANDGERSGLEQKDRASAARGHRSLYLPTADSHEAAPAPDSETDIYERKLAKFFEAPSDRLSKVARAPTQPRGGVAEAFGGTPAPFV